MKTTLRSMKQLLTLLLLVTFLDSPLVANAQSNIPNVSIGSAIATCTRLYGAPQPKGDFLQFQHGDWRANVKAVNGNVVEVSYVKDITERIDSETQLLFMLNPPDADIRAVLELNGEGQEWKETKSSFSQDVRWTGGTKVEIDLPEAEWQRADGKRNVKFWVSNSGGQLSKILNVAPPAAPRKAVTEE